MFSNILLDNSKEFSQSSFKVCPAFWTRKWSCHCWASSLILRPLLPQTSSVKQSFCSEFIFKLANTKIKRANTFFYPLPPFFLVNLSTSSLILFSFFRVISDEKALSVSIAYYLGQGLELIAFVYVAVNFLFRLIFIFPMFEIH